MSVLKAYDTILSPHVTEKSTIVAEHDQVVFEVARTASKPDIKAAVETLFGVKVKAVNTLVRKGKVKRFRGHTGTQKTKKYAYVTLHEGERIDVTTGL